MKTSPRIGPAWVVGVALVGSLHAAHARKASPGEDACLADVVCVGLYEEARRLSKGGDFATALAAYQGAHRRRPVPWLLINIGRTLHKLGRPAEALAYYRRYLSEEPKGPADRAQTVNDYIAQAEKAESERAASQAATPVERTPSPVPVPPDGQPPSAAPTASPPAGPAGVGAAREPATPDKGRGETKSGDAKSGDAKSGDAKSGDAKSGDAKSGETKGEEPAPAALGDSPASTDTPSGRAETAARGTSKSPDSGGGLDNNRTPAAPVTASAAAGKGSPPDASASALREPAGGNSRARAEDKARYSRAVPAYFWAGLGVGGALLVGGAAVGTAALVESSALQSTPFAGMPPSSLLDQQSRLRSFAISSDVLLAVGGTTVGVVSLVMLIQRYANVKQKR